MTYKIINIDLSHPRVNQVYNLFGNSIKVINATSDCFIQFDDTTQDPINLLLVDEIKIKFKKFYISNVGIKNQSIKIIVSEGFSLCDRIGIPKYIESPSTFPGFNFRIPITIPHTKVIANEVNCPIYIKLRQNNFNFTKARNDGLDVCFTKSDGLTLLDFERDRHDGINLKGDYIVKIPNISSINDTKFFMYYGNLTAADISNPTAVWDTNYVARWSLKEDPAGLAPQMKDSTINVNHGATHGVMASTQSIEGQIGKALSFDGVNDNVEVPSNANLKLNDFTISCFVKGNAAPGTAVSAQYLAKGANGRNFNFTWSHPNALFKQSVTFRGINGVWQRAQIASTLLANTWYHITGRWNSTTDTLDVFLNGVLEGSETGITTTPAVDDVVLKIGSSIGETPPHTAISFFTGQLDEIRISNIARSNSWIDLQYKSQNNTLLNFGPEESV